MEIHQSNKFEYEVSVVMPCLNEEETIGICIKKATETMNELGINGEVVISDNGSTDKSIEIAESLGARVVYQPVKGYGSAYLKGFMEAKGKYIVMGDSDDSYDFTDIERFIEPLRNGYDMVMGSRLKGEIKPGAMPWLHRYIGNPLLSWFLNVLFRTGVSDSHCGMRSFTKEAFKMMNLRTTGMEFASEMVINSAKAGLKIKEIPITLYPDGRTGEPHLRSFRDGWRHLKLMLMYSPTYLFLLPGIFLIILGFIPLIALLGGPIYIGGHGYDMHFMILGSMLVVVGLQIIFLGLFAKAYSYDHNFPQYDNFIVRFYNKFSVERGILIGFLFFLSGLSIMVYLLIKYFNVKGFFEIRLTLLGMNLIVTGTQIIFSSFLLEMLKIDNR